MKRRYEYTMLPCASLDEINALADEGWRYVGNPALMQPDPESDGDTTETALPALLFERERHEVTA